MRSCRAHRKPHDEPRGRRAGASTIDYVLVLCVILPMAAIVVPAGMRAARLVHEMITVFVAWPFL
ncbi:MAG: hypothetical protein ACE5KM_17280 [Planctomycetaceae bacterium]